MAKSFLEKLNMKPKEIILSKPKLQEIKVKKNSIQVIFFFLHLLTFQSHFNLFSFSKSFVSRTSKKSVLTETTMESKYRNIFSFIKRNNYSLIEH